MDRLRRTLLLATLCLLPTPVGAQIVDAQRLLTGDEEGFVAGVDGSVDLRRGDVDLTSVAGGATARYRRGDLAVLVLLQGERATTGGIEILEKDMEHLRFRWVGASVQAETFFQHDRDRFRRRELRALWGAGPRFVIAEAPARSLALGLAAMAEYERLSAGPWEDSGRTTVRTRASAYASGRIRPREHVGMGQTLYVQPRVDDASDVRLLSETELLVALVGRVSLKLSASVMHDSRPPESVQAWQLALKTALHLDLSRKKP